MEGSDARQTMLREAEWRTVFEKLVRDGVPAQLDAKGVEHEVRVAEPEEMRNLLLAKLEEEVRELRAAGSDEEAIDEIADIFEVLAALADRHGADETRARSRQEARRAARGSFDKGIVLRWTEQAR